MSKGTQLLGTKISLISKSEIRYEGILFSLNPNESTLALAKVRMFGTENRPAENPVAARDEVFEFIIFRGQDIKDIRLCEAPTPQPPIPGGLPYDPAILQHSVPGVGALGAAGLQQPTGLAGSIMRPTFGPLSGLNYPNLEGAAPGGPLGQLGNLMAPGLTAGLGGLAGGLGLSGAAAVAAASELPLSPHGDLPPHPDHVSEGDQDLLTGVGVRSNNSTPVAGASGTTSQSRKSPTLPESSNKEENQPRTSSRGSGSNRKENDNRGGRGGNRSNSRGRRGGNSQGGQTQGDRGGQSSQGSFNRFANNFSRNKGPIKFDEDYDFESANSKFEELKSKMGKMKIGGDTVLVLNGPPAEGEKKEKPETESSEVVTSLADGEASTEALVSAPEEAKSDSPVKPPCYDKSRSFFDSISCEAVERSKGNTQRTDWRQERKLNAETFGLPFNQRRGGYHRGGGGGGRGYYGGRGGGNGGYYRQNNDGYQPRGGRGGYRGGRGGRGNNNGGNRDSEGTGQSRGYNQRRNWQQQENRA